MARYVLLLSILILMSALRHSGQAMARDVVACPPAEDIPYGETAGNIIHDGLRRDYLLYIPQSYDGMRPSPLVLSLHGFASSPTAQRDLSLWNDSADENGFIVVYPRGAGFPSRWNSGPNPFGLAEIDDVGFISALLDHLSTQLCIDPQRIYTSGLSAGVGMSHRLVCELSGRIAAMGGVAGAYNDIPCQPERPVPIIAFHGTADRIAPYEGGISGPFTLLGVATWAADWAARNGCDAIPSELPRIGAVVGARYDNCDADVAVVLYTVIGGGHTWPGGGPQSAFLSGETNRDINATALMWAFFSQYTLDSR